MLRKKNITLILKSLWLLVKIISLITITVLTTLLLVKITMIISAPFTSTFETKSPSDSERLVIHVVNRYQYAYYFEHLTFSKNAFKDTIIKENSTYYNHYFEVEDNLGIIYAVPKQKYNTRKFLKLNLGVDKKDPFYSYVGAVSATKIDNNSPYFSDIVCQNKSIGIIKPSKPILKNNTLSCGKGTKNIK